MDKTSNRYRFSLEFLKILSDSLFFLLASVGLLAIMAIAYYLTLTELQKIEFCVKYLL